MNIHTRDKILGDIDEFIMHTLFEFESLKWFSSPPVSGLRSEIRLEEVGDRQTESFSS